MLTFGLKGGYDAGVKLVSNVKLFSHLANIGDTRSLIIHPASTTHRQLTDAQRAQAGAGSDVVRLSVGLEDKEDIIADLEEGSGGGLIRLSFAPLKRCACNTAVGEQDNRHGLMQQRERDRRCMHQRVHSDPGLREHRQRDPARTSIER